MGGSPLLIWAPEVPSPLGQGARWLPFAPLGRQLSCWSCSFSSAACPHFSFPGCGCTADPLSWVLLTQTHPSHVLFSPRFGDDIPGMEGLGTGKHCRVMMSCPALTQVQPCFSRGEDYLGWLLSLLGLSAALRVTREGQDSLCKLPQSCLCLHTLQDRKAI